MIDSRDPAACDPPASTLGALVEHYARIAGESEAVVCGDVRLSYAALRRQCADVAQGLRAMGVAPGSRVGLLMGNCAEWIVSAVAATSLGATVVALNTWWTAKELEYALEHSQATVLIATAGYLRRDYAADLEALRAQGRLPALRTIVGVGPGIPSTWQPWASLLGPWQVTPSLADAPPDGIALLLYTSGSTSRPKGVQLAHGHLVENTWHIGERQKLSGGDRLWLAVSLFWGFGCSNALPAVFSHGGCIVLQPSFDAAEALALIERERCTVVYGTPNMFQAMAEHPDRGRRDLGSLRTGATLGSPEQIRRVVNLGAAKICNVYGLTEVYGNSHATSADDPLELRLQSCGRPLPGILQRIVDPESGQDVAVGQVGEIRVKGRVMRGYLGDDAQTVAAFDDQGFFRTGDLGTVDAKGNLRFRGRLKELVKTGGINVSPTEIEAVLMTHPGVEHALVAGVPDPVRDEVLAAVIVPRKGCAPSEEELRAHCRAQLAVYKVPSLIRFTTEAALPLTTTGKVQKNRLAEVFFTEGA